MDKATLERYSRQLNLPDFDLKHQKKLAGARVLIVGAGGLGSPLILYLAAAGIGNIGIIDFDKVEIHNLHRQILYSSKDISKRKVDIAKEKVNNINPDINCTVYTEVLNTENVKAVFENYDIIADGTDNFPTRYLINDACVKFEKTNVFASVQRYEGQVAVFNKKKEDGTFSCNYRDLFPVPPLENTVPNCAEAGVLGPVVGMIACLQAQEVIKIACGKESKLVNTILSIDIDDYQMRTFKLKENPSHHFRNENKENIILKDYENLCKLDIAENLELNSSELLSKLASDKNIQVIDIRETHEYLIHNIGAENIPKDEFLESLSDLDKDTSYILHCKTGVRSRSLLHKIIKTNTLKNIFHLEGGLQQWIIEQGADAKIPS